MSLTLFIPATFAAASPIGIALIASVTVLLSGSLFLGYHFKDTNVHEDTSDDPSFSSLIAELKDFSRQTKTTFDDTFREFKQDSKLVFENTEKLDLLSAQLADAAQSTKKKIKHLRSKVQEPLERVETTLSTTQKKINESTIQLKKTQEELAEANRQISVLTVTLKEQQETLMKLNAQVIPLTNALAIQTKENKKAQKKIEILKANYDQQINALTEEKQQLQESLKQEGLITKKLEDTVQVLEQNAASLEASFIQLQGDYETKNRQYQEICLLTTSLNQEAQEQEALIAAQEQVIANLIVGHPSTPPGSLSFFRKEAPASGRTKPADRSLTPR